LSYLVLAWGLFTRTIKFLLLLVARRRATGLEKIFVAFFARQEATKILLFV
jgi:hypothetical protein